MSVAIPIPLLQNLPDVNVTPGSGVDEYALVYDHDTAKFVLRAPVAPFDGTPYALLAGRAGGQTLYGGTAANDDITIHGTSDATRTTSYVILQPTAGNVGIGTTTPTTKLQVASGHISTNATYGLYSYGLGSFGGTNTEYLTFYHSGTGAIIDSNKTGTGTARSILFQIAGQTKLTVESTGNVGIDAGALTMAEMTAPTGVANKATVYARDNGSGKTMYCLKLGDDVEIVLATQA